MRIWAIAPMTPNIASGVPTDGLLRLRAMRCVLNGPLNFCRAKAFPRRVGFRGVSRLIGVRPQGESRRPAGFVGILNVRRQGICVGGVGRAERAVFR